MSISTHKSDVFSMLATIPENALNIYNALNKTNYTDLSLIKISYLENGFSLSLHNDASFIFDNRYLNIYEHQSTYCPNMPFRELIYYIHSIEKTSKDIKTKLYTSTKVYIPTPNFVVLYNGRQKRPATEIMKLSDSFLLPTDNPQLEVKCTVYNINPGYNDELLAASSVLQGYTTFVELVRDNLQYHPLEDSINMAIDHCINHNILRDFFTKNREEIIGVIMLDYTFETQLANYEADLNEANSTIQEQNVQLQQQSTQLQQQRNENQKLKEQLDNLLSWAKAHGFDEQMSNTNTAVSES